MGSLFIAILSFTSLLVNGLTDLNKPIVHIGKSRLYTAKELVVSVSTTTTGPTASSSAKKLVNVSTPATSSSSSFSSSTPAPKFDSDDLKKAIQVLEHYSKFQNFDQVFDEIAKESPKLNEYLESLVEGGANEYHRILNRMSPTASEFFKEVYLSTAAYGIEIVAHFKRLDKDVQEEITSYYPKFSKFFKSKLFESVFYDVRLKKALEEEAAKKSSAHPKIQKASEFETKTVRVEQHSDKDDDDDDDIIDPFDDEDVKVDDIEGNEVYPEDDD